MTLLLIAIAPGLALAIFIYFKDKFEKEPLHLLLISFALGALSTIPAFLMEKAGIMLGFGQSSNMLMTALFAFVVIGGSEEFCKYLMVRHYAFPKKDFNEPFDGIVYAVMVSLGFATLENIVYVLSQPSFAESMQVGLLRMFTAVPAHAAFAIVMGYNIGKAKFDPAKKEQWMKRGLFSAIVLHGAYDFFLLQNNVPGLGFLAIVVLIIGIRIARKSIKEHQDASPFKNGD